jgi:hypothetical protein
MKPGFFLSIPVFTLDRSKKVFLHPVLFFVLKNKTFIRAASLNHLPVAISIAGYWLALVGTLCKGVYLFKKKRNSN